MKWFAALVGVAGLGASGLGTALYSRPEVSQNSANFQLVVLGNHRGYLSPCGCSDPMTGGVLREAALIRRLQSQGTCVVVDTGDLTDSDSRQEVMKAQTLAQTLKSLDVAAINLTPTDLKLGSGELLNLQDLAGSTFVSANLSHADDLAVQEWTEKGRCLIVGLTGLSSSEAALKEAEKTAFDQGLKLVVLLEGDQRMARLLAQAHPKVDIVVYRSERAPSQIPEREGQTILISPGERGEYVVSLSFGDRPEPSLTVYKLTPEIPVDPTALQFYRAYLDRVDRSDLWKRFPRNPGKPYAGAAACGKCHQSDYHKWQTEIFRSDGQPSAHFKSLQTLVDRGHGRDPECLPCHVTGADFSTGYRTKKQDPQLAFVGCESCHGPGEAHAAEPKLNRMPVVPLSHRSQVCETCHKPLNSPNFDFGIYWARIAHGNGENRWKSKK